MLRTLLESQSTRSRRGGGTLISVGLHTAVIALAIAATARATLPPRIDPPRRADLTYRVITPPPNEQQHRTSFTTSSGTTLLPPFSHVIVPPLKAPTGLPAIDATQPRVGEIIFGTRTSLGDRPSAGGLTGSVDEVYTPNLVDKAVVPQPGNPAPIYPSTLRAAQIEGELVARFVVDTMGRVEAGTISMASATHALFADAVRQSLLRSHYVPAIAAGRTVRQLVEQRFAFTLTR